MEVEFGVVEPQAQESWAVSSMAVQRIPMAGVFIVKMQPLSVAARSKRTLTSDPPETEAESPVQAE
jgi:hypothetical protein